MLNGRLGIESVDDVTRASDHRVALRQNAAKIRQQLDIFIVVGKLVHSQALIRSREGKYMQPRHILFVDDNFVFNWGAREALQDSGFVVDSVYSGQSAIDFIDSHDSFHALATDIDLGPGPDGFDVARHARAVHPQLPVIYMSGIDHPDFATRGVSDSEFLAKPFAPERIADALFRVIRLAA
jgi:CheY-like chemotaxis protein